MHLIHTAMTIISLFYYCEKLFTVTNMKMTEKFNKMSLLENEDFYSHLNMEYITCADHVHVERDF